MGAVFQARTERAVAQRAHLLALVGRHFAASPGYRRADERLRRSLRSALPPLDDLGGVDLAWVAGGGPGDDRDGAWFATRWAGGEEAQTAAAAQRLAAAAAAVPIGGLLATQATEILVAPGLRGEASPLGPGRVLAGLDTPAILVVLAAIASHLPTGALPAALDEADARDVALHMAGSALVLEPLPSDALDGLLLASTTALLPPQHQGDRLAGLVDRLVALNALDQPPGEIERLTRGLQRRYSDRLHRAWLRGFFVPRGFDLGGWRDTLRGGP